MQALQEQQTTGETDSRAPPIEGGEQSQEFTSNEDTYTATPPHIYAAAEDDEAAAEDADEDDAEAAAEVYAESASAPNASTRAAYSVCAALLMLTAAVFYR